MRIIVDGRPVEFEAGDSLLVAMLREGAHPTGGGCLCLGGDCPHCLATVDGVSYVRTCQTPAKPGLVVERNHLGGAVPPMPGSDLPGPEVPARSLQNDVVVIGAGESGRAAAQESQAAGKTVVLLEAADGQEAVGLYVGPLVVVRTESGMLHVHAREQVIVATGAAEIQPVAPGAELAGLLTTRAAEQLAAAGLDLGRVVAVGTAPEGIEAELAAGDLLRFEGEGTVSAVVLRGEDGQENRYPCDTVTIGLGLHPRDGLRRQGHDLPGVRAVGDAARESDIPPCPAAGVVCPCAGVTVADLDAVWSRGFHDMELVKRATLAGTGTCQGSACLPHLRSFLADRGQALQPSFTARPVTRQVTLAEIAAGGHHVPTPRTALHDEHLRLGAQMERIGGWWRPWHYGRVEEEYWAVREGVSIGDVSTLGKMLVSGPDALVFLERLYPTQVSTIRMGRMRYVLLLDERGYVLDDGMIAKDTDTRYALTFTTGGAGFAEMWLRDWAASWGLNVRLLNRTHALGAINVTGPLAGELLARIGLPDPPVWLGHKRAEVGGAPCHVYRLSFTGELSYELHHPVERSVDLWRALLEAGADLGVRPHGLDALLQLRLEKGHILVGQDTDYDSTPRRLHHEWAVRMDKEYFIGQAAVRRTDRVPLDKQLVGLEMDVDVPGETPFEGAVIWHGGEYAGYVTSSAYSPVLGKAVMLAWLFLFDGALPDAVQVEGRAARRAPLPFYDPEGSRARG